MFKHLMALILACIPMIAIADPVADFMDAALDGLRAQTMAHSQGWSLGNEKSWAANLELGTITFTFDNGIVASTSIQVVGSYNPDGGTFMWAWDNPSIPDRLKAHSLLAKTWGKKNKQPQFTKSMIRCTEEEAWKLAATANRLADANGVYRGPADSSYVFFTLGKIQLEMQKPPQPASADK